MANIDEIINRIKDRNNLIENKEIKIKKKNHNGLNFAIALLALFSVSLSFLIYAKKDENANFLREKFNIEVNFSKINEAAENFIDKFLVFEYNFNPKNNDLYVGINDSYILLDNKYYNNSGKIFALDDGVVTIVNENLIRVEHDNGCIVDYKNVCEAYVYKFDRVKENQTIGTFEEFIEILVYKDGVIIDYEEFYS